MGLALPSGLADLHNLVIDLSGNVSDMTDEATSENDDDLVDEIFIEKAGNNEDPFITSIGFLNKG